MADQPGYRAPLAVFIAAALPAIAALLLGAMICRMHFSQHYKPGILPADGMDTVQAARYLAQTRTLGTNVLRPLLLASQTTHGDGSLPDLAHPPLHLALCALLMRVRHHVGPGDGDQDAILVSMVCFVASLGACYLLYTRCFGYRNALLACLIFALGGSAMANALTARPTLLATLLFTLVLIALFNSDKASSLAETVTQSERNGKTPEAAQARKRLVRQSVLWAAAAGVGFGLLYLSAYSSVILTLPIGLYLWLNARRSVLPPLAFLGGALLAASPILLYNFRANHSPFYNTRLIELVMNTETYPGYSLYRAANLPLPITQYLVQGGLSEISRKAANNLLGFYGRAPYVLGTFLLPLLIGSALIRFADSRVNRIRGLLLTCICLHMVGLSLFQSYEETAPLLLMYAPAASVLGIGFLLSVVRARNLPRFYRQAAITGWMLIASIPGVILLTAPAASETPVSTVYSYLNNTSPQMQVLRPKHAAFVASDAPWEMAFRCDYPSVWLPQDSGVMQTTAQRTGRSIDGIVLAGDLRGYPEADVLPWQLLYNRLTAVADMATSLTIGTKSEVLSQIRLYYPQELAGGLSGFIPVQRPREGGSYPLLLWNPKLTASVSAGGKR